MMYDKLIRQLRNCAIESAPCKACDMVNDDSCTDGLMKQAADAIEELSTVVRVQKAVLEKFPRWIPVTERLPEERINPNTRDFEYVLCVTIWGDVRPYKYGTPTGEKEAHFWNGAGYVDAYVTHWMPLPERPEEGE